MLYKRFLTKYELTFAIIPRPLSRFNSGYIEQYGYGVGILVKITDNGRVFWHKPCQFLDWNFNKQQLRLKI
jgi:hypothetical protein